MYYFLQSRCRSGGVQKSRIGIPTHYGAHYFLCSAPSVGMRFSLVCNTSPAGPRVTLRMGLKMLFRKICFFKTPSAKLTVLQKLTIKQMKYQHF